MPSETLFTSTLSDGNMQFIALTPSELFMPVRNVMPDVVFSYSDLPTPENASLLLTTYWV